MNIFFLNLQHYFFPLRSVITSGTKFIVDGKPMTLENVNSIFNNIEMILQINEVEVLPKLKELKEKWNDQDTGIGQAFIKWVSNNRFLVGSHKRSKFLK